MNAAIIAVAVTAALALSGCGGEDGGENGHDNSGLHIERVMVDGRFITCVVYTVINRGGVSCDWESGSTP